jgi:tetratricopeptide (TPR) repeat protein
MPASSAAAIRTALARNEPLLALELLGAQGGDLETWARVSLTFRAATTAKAFTLAGEAAGEAMASFPDRPESHLYLTTALLNLGRRREGLRAAEAALGRFPDDARLIEIAARAAADNGRSPEAVSRYERLIVLGHSPQRQHLRIARHYTGLYRGAEALEQFEMAIALGADRDEQAPQMAVAAERAGQYNLAVSLWSRAIETGRAGEEGRIALERLARHIRRDELSGRSRVEAQDLWNMRKRGGALTTRGDIRVWRSPGSRDLALVFGGLQTMMNVAPPMAPSSMVERGDINILSFRDANRLLMLDGAASLAKDYQGTLERLNSLMAAWRIRRLYVAGYSVGGLAALRYAVDLGARRLLLMSGVLAMPTGTPQPFLADLVARGGHRYFDARAYLAEQGGGMEVTAAFGAENAGDIWQAHRLAGVPGVTLRPLEGVSQHALALAPQHDQLIEAWLGDEASLSSARA